MGANNSKSSANIAVNKLRVLPLSIGYADADGMMYECIPKNTTIPTKKFEEVIFPTNQESVAFTFYQGQRSKASDNKFLDRLVFYDGTPPSPAPKGTGRALTLCLKIDANGILRASIEDKETSRKSTTLVYRSVLPPKEEVEEMIREGEKHALEDKEYEQRTKIVRSMIDYSGLLREIAAAGNYSGKVMRSAVKDVAVGMLDEFKEKVKELDY